MQTPDNETPTKPDEIDPKFQIKRPRAPRPWRVHELAAWVVLVVLAAGVFWQHRRLERLRADLRREIEVKGDRADKQIFELVDQLRERVTVAERRVQQCMSNIEKGGP